jgi:hypothetical protein
VDEGVESGAGDGAKVRAQGGNADAGANRVEAVGDSLLQVRVQDRERPATRCGPEKGTRLE